MLNNIHRRPWASRAALLVIVTSLGTIAATLGLATDVVDEAVGAIGLVLALLVDLGILRDGETETTPVDDPVGRDGLPLMPFRRLEDLRQALDAGDVDAARELAGPSPHV